MQKVEKCITPMSDTRIWDRSPTHQFNVEEGKKTEIQNRKSKFPQVSQET